MPGGVLGLELAEELETLRPFGMGNPQPTLLVPAARFQHVTGMGEDKEHARFTLVTAGGARSRGVAFGSPPKALAPAAEDNHDIALRLERNRWNGMVEPRVILRALCPTKPGELRVLGRGGLLLGAAGARARGPVSARDPRLARARGRAGSTAAARASPASPGTSSRAASSVLVAVADVPRRRRGLEEIVAGLAPGGMAVASWAAIAADPTLARSRTTTSSRSTRRPAAAPIPLLRAARRAHLAWGPAEAEFALHVWRAELDLRPALADALPRPARAAGRGRLRRTLEQALAGTGRYPRTPECCARLLAVLDELELVELVLDRRSCRVREGVRARPRTVERLPRERRAPGRDRACPGRRAAAARPARAA